MRLCRPESPDRALHGLRGREADGLWRGGLIGNWLGGLWVDRTPLATTTVFSVALALGMAASMLFAGLSIGFAIALGVWGIANTALYPVCRTRVMKAYQRIFKPGKLTVGSMNRLPPQVATGGHPLR